MPPSAEPEAPLYSEAQLEALVGLLRRANRLARTDTQGLLAELEALLLATGVAVGTSEYARAFRKAADAEPPPQVIARRFKRIAIAINPLDPAICGEDERQLLELHIRRSPTSLELRFQSNPTPIDPSRLPDFRRAAARLAQYYQSLVERGAPRKSAIDTCLNGCGEIYLRGAGLDLGLAQLSARPDSLFVRFMHQVLQPFVHSSECSLSALASRWKRLRRLNRTGLRPRPRPKKRNLAKRL